MAHPSAGMNPEFPAIGMTAWAKVGRWWKKATVVRVPKAGGEVLDGSNRKTTVKCVIHGKVRKQTSAWIQAINVVRRDKAQKGSDKPA